MADRYTDPDPARSALIIIDTQNDFTLPQAIACVPGTAEAVPAIADLLRLYRSVQRPIFHIVRLYQADGSNADACRRTLIKGGAAIARPGTHGAQPVDALMPEPSLKLDAETLLSGKPQIVGPQEWILYKPRWSAFHQTSLESMLRGVDVDTLIIVGCNFPNCPRSTIYDASNRDFRIVVVTDAMSGLYDKGMGELHNIGVHTTLSHAVADWPGFSRTME